MALVVDPHTNDPFEQNITLYKSLIYLSDIYRTSEEVDKCLDCLKKCIGLTDSDDHFERLAEIYMEKGSKQEFLEVTKILFSKKPDDKHIRKMHNLACMLNNIQSAT